MIILKQLKGGKSYNSFLDEQGIIEYFEIKSD